ncbi:hypothetical protein [Fredinandcohnia sp. 179-A 10B2 NHS]|uniref:hypothetical protein n=1 Tax=Fredinandcohnia sp. 179-A 10B2 NHS TaxID=3235176 RepID=UPI0039A2F7DE
MKFFSQGGDYGKGAALILGKKPVHNMKDSYRVWLAYNQDKLKEIEEMQCNIPEESVLKYTPISVSHSIRGNYHKRYDYIMISEHFCVRNVEYRLEGAIRAGSDHAMVIADLHYDLGKV